MKKNSLVSETVDRCHRSCDKVNFPQRTRVYDITSFLLFDVYPSCIRTSFLLPHKDDQDPCSSATLPCHVSIVPCLPALNSHLDSNHTSCTSNFPTVISNADSYEWPNQSPFHLLSTSLKNTVCTSWNRISGQGAFDAFRSSSLLSSWDRDVPYSPSFVLDLAASVDEHIKNVVDFVFLPGFNNPTVAVLFQSQQTWTG